MIAPRYHDQPHWLHPTVCVPARTGMRTETIVEIGPGNGWFLQRLAAQHPTHHIVGIEIQWTRFDQQRAQCREFGNVSCVRGDARLALPEVTAQCGPIVELHIHFSDPWPKRKHAGHRLMSPDFIVTCRQALAPEGRIFFTTDHAPYAEATARWFAQTAGLRMEEPLDHAPFPSYFADKWQRAGRTIYAQVYRRV